MEGLRIRIPNNRACSSYGCFERTHSIVCRYCSMILASGVGQEMSAAALPRKPKFVHSPALSRLFSSC